MLCQKNYGGNNSGRLKENSNWEVLGRRNLFPSHGWTWRRTSAKKLNGSGEELLALWCEERELSSAALPFVYGWMWSRTVLFIPGLRQYPFKYMEIFPLMQSC